VPDGGCIAAALIAARLLGLDQRRAVHALGIAGSFAAGSLEFLADGSSTKQLHPGWAAQSGVRAAWLAADGATGPATILEGERGLYRLFTDGDHSAASIVAGLGQRWELLRITLKPYPACQLVHAALDATADLGLDADDLGRAAGVTVEVPPDAVDVVCEPADAKRRPRTPYDAKFSLHWAVATMLHDSAVTPASFTPEAITRPAVARLADLVRYTVTDHRVAAAAAPSTVEIDLGCEVRAASVPASRGGPDRPLTDADVRRKLTANVGHAARAGAIMDAVTGLPDARDLSVLTDAMVDSERRVVA
jgi:2-methylcitrate dehydratase PrpD